MRILVLGAGGLLGRDVCAEAPPDVRVEARSHAELDVTDAAAIRATIGALHPAWVVNCAGFADVDGAEAREADAEQVNALAPANIGVAAAASGVRVAHVSTDYVFDGSIAGAYTERDPPAPLNAYGRTKLAGERALLSALPGALVVRTQWMYGAAGRSFVRTMWECARASTRSRVVTDQYGAPTWSRDVARALWRLVGANAGGVVHYSAAGVGSRYDVARAVYGCLGRGALVSPATTADLPRATRRPPRTVLDTRHYTAITGDTPPAWRTALAGFLSMQAR